MDDGAGQRTASARLKSQKQTQQRHGHWIGRSWVLPRVITGAGAAAGERFHRIPGTTLVASDRRHGQMGGDSLAARRDAGPAIVVGGKP